MLKAFDLAKAIEDGALTPLRLVEQIIEVIAAREPAIQAFAHFDAAALRKAAADYKGQGALRGIPVAFKDIIDTADAPTAYGSPIYAGWQPRADAPIVAQTRAAGGLMLGKSATTEFAFLNPAATHNPHSAAHTPGGSSAGSAAGVAAGMMPLAFGTQTGGSVIRPAAFCGVTAIKTSFRLLPTVGAKTGAWTLDTLGLFGARVADVAFGLEAITGRSLRVDGKNAGAPRFAVCRMPFAGEVSPDAEAGLDLAVRAIEKAGGSVVDIDMPAEFTAAHEAHPVIYNYEGGVALAWEIARHRAELSEVLLQHFAPQPPISHDAYDAARRVAKRARNAAKAFFDGFDALVTYSAPGAAPDRSTTGSATFNRLFTLLGTPCVNVPVTRIPSGLPISIQIVCGFGQDAKALLASNFVEGAVCSYR